MFVANSHDIIDASERRYSMGNIGEPQHEIELEPIEEPVNVPVQEPVPV